MSPFLALWPVCPSVSSLLQGLVPKPAWLRPWHPPEQGEDGSPPAASSSVTAAPPCREWGGCRGASLQRGCSGTPQTLLCRLHVDRGTIFYILVLFLLLGLANSQATSPALRVGVGGCTPRRHKRILMRGQCPANRFPTTPPTLRNQNGSSIPKENEASFVKTYCWRPCRSFPAPRE